MRRAMRTMDGGWRIDEQALKAANINPATLLATDYLNHYNEVAMTIGMLADMPDMLESVLEWRPVDYATHFHQTSFRDRELAVAAYEHAPADARARFEEACGQVELAVAEVQDILRHEPDAAAELASHSPAIFALIARVGGVINGDAPVIVTGDDPSQADIDALFA